MILTTSYIKQNINEVLVESTLVKLISNYKFIDIISMEAIPSIINSNKIALYGYDYIKTLENDLNITVTFDYSIT